MLKATYDPDNNGIVSQAEKATKLVLPGNAGAPPAADALYEGSFYYHKPGAGNPSVLYFCIAQSGGGFEWLVVGFSSQ